MRAKPVLVLLALGVAVAGLPACGSGDRGAAPPPSGTPSATAGFPTGEQAAAPVARTGLGGPGASPSPSRRPATTFRAGNPAGRASVPAEARAVDTSRPTRTVGTGTPASCTSAAVVKAVAAGGVITFDCGPDPVTIRMTATAKVRNANGPKVVLDGGGKVTLSGQGKRRILYMNTCDEAQGWTTSHCQNQDHPQLTVQNITFADGNSTGEQAEGGGGGAIFVRGGRVKVVNSRFVSNRCDRTGPDLGGAALRVLSQYDNKPVYVVNSTFEKGSCANGGALSGIGVSWTVLNSLFTGNEAIGNGANPAKAGTPGGGSGGAIYCDGNRFTVRIAGTVIENNRANEGGGAIFFVSNDRTGTMTIENSTLRRNRSGQFETRGYPGIFFLGARNPSTPGSRLS
ncbi:hypothetical protein [Micromonospora costi]|uniref:Right-handed parallel beta-helix repeat-containing protein n=1 Tax=Micromonospora costi TaxID=1530042 RepID=A0A3B0AEZ0_9ACTN|nr:hypothetical protein [Micromonospora costi]RKN58871.1 hypothetical protein D7193_10240 [Micromonospora costi]